jgi:hypothetical protein
VFFSLHDRFWVKPRIKEWEKIKVSIWPCSFTATLPIFFVTMPHIAPQKIVDWQQNSCGYIDTLIIHPFLSHPRRYWATTFLLLEDKLRLFTQ